MPLNATDYTFDAHYREEAQLGDGTRVVLRLVQPGDRELLRRGFERLSSESRYLRFMSVKPRLSEADLDALMDLDGEERFAIGAVRADGDGDRSEGLGVARFVRLADDPEVAEAAVTVVDEAQGRGLGSLLLRRLAAAARERGIRYFRGEILVRNQPMQRLLEDHAAARVVSTGEGTVQVLVELPDPDAAAGSSGPGELLERMLAQAAGGGLAIRLGDVLLKRR